MLELKHIHKYYNPGTVNEMCLFQDFNLTIEDGEFVSVVGSNGSGKTSMLNIICGSIPAEGGQICIGGKDISKEKEYQRNRILGFLFPEQYSDTFLQQKNSIMAIGSGGFFGKGLYNTDISSVKAGNFLIEEDTDFIFAIIGEELGFRGSMGILFLYILLIMLILWIGLKSKNLTGSAICVGVAAWLGFQTFTNVAVATAIFPNTGVTLPFISRGASSLLSVYIAIGIILNVGLQSKD